MSGNSLAQVLFEHLFCQVEWPYRLLNESSIWGVQRHAHVGEVNILSHLVTYLYAVVAYV